MKVSPDRQSQVKEGDGDRLFFIFFVLANTHFPCCKGSLLSPLRFPATNPPAPPTSLSGTMSLNAFESN